MTSFLFSPTLSCLMIEIGCPRDFSYCIKMHMSNGMLLFPLRICFSCFAFAVAHDLQILSAPLVMRMPSAAAVLCVFPLLECPKIAWACSMLILIAGLSCTLLLSPLLSLIPAATSPSDSGRRMYAHHETPLGVSTLISNLMTHPPFSTDRPSFLV